MRVLMLSRFPDRASAHFRFFQYLPWLRAEGIKVEPAPLFGKHYLNSLLDGAGKSPHLIVIDYLRRIARLFVARKFDLLWLQMEAFPWMPAIAERMLTVYGIPYVADYDDAWFHRYDLHSNRFARRVLGRKIDWVMRNARLVVAGNNYIADRAKRAGARWIECIPTAVDLNDYSPVTPPRNHTFTVGWLGSRSTSGFLLEDRFRSAMARLCTDGGARLVVVGAEPDPRELSQVDLEVHRWTKESEAREVMGFDVGVAPLVDSPFERGKCGFKVVQYMAAGRPVVVSPVGIQAELVSHGENGFLATTSADWTEALARLRSDAPMRERMGRAGRRRVEQHYCTQVTAPRIARLLRTAAGIETDRTLSSMLRSGA